MNMRVKYANRKHCFFQKVVEISLNDVKFQAAFTVNSLFKN